MATRNYAAVGLTKSLVTQLGARVNFNHDGLFSTDSEKLQGELEEFLADNLIEEVLDVEEPVANAAAPEQKGVTGIINTQKAAIASAQSNTTDK
jgi:hypothetical protein